MHHQGGPMAAVGGQAVSQCPHGNPRPFGMPPFGLALDDEEIAAIASFLRSSWGARAGAVSPQDVARFRGGAGD